MSKDVVQEIEISQIKPFLDRESDRADFNRLKASIQKHGVQNPITLRAISKRKSGKKAKKSKEKRWMWEHVDGHRRRRACEELGRKTIPAILRNVEDAEQTEMFYIENEVREELTAYEKAELMQKDLGKLSIEEIADKYNMRVSYVRTCLDTLQGASKELTQAMKNQEITLDDGKTLAKLPPEEQLPFIELVRKKGIRGKEVGRTVRAHKEAAGPRKVTHSILQKTASERIKELEALKNERDNALRRYQLGVETLEVVLQDPDIRTKLRKAKIDFSRFFQE